jgi:hypothetical protein
MEGRLNSMLAAGPRRNAWYRGFRDLPRVARIAATSAFGFVRRTCSSVTTCTQFPVALAEVPLHLHLSLCRESLPAPWLHLTAASVKTQHPRGPRTAKSDRRLFSRSASPLDLPAGKRDTCLSAGWG